MGGERRDRPLAARAPGPVRRRAGRQGDPRHLARQRPDHRPGPRRRHDAGARPGDRGRGRRDPAGHRLAARAGLLRGRRRLVVPRLRAAPRPHLPLGRAPAARRGLGGHHRLRRRRAPRQQGRRGPRHRGHRLAVLVPEPRALVPQRGHDAPPAADRGLLQPDPGRRVHDARRPPLPVRGEPHARARLAVLRRPAAASGRGRVRQPDRVGPVRDGSPRGRRGAPRDQLARDRSAAVGDRAGHRPPGRSHLAAGAAEGPGAGPLAGRRHRPRRHLRRVGPPAARSHADVAAPDRSAMAAGRAGRPGRRDTRRRGAGGEPGRARCAAPADRPAVERSEAPGRGSPLARRAARDPLRAEGHRRVGRRAGAGRGAAHPGRL